MRFSIILVLSALSLSARAQDVVYDTVTAVSAQDSSAEYSSTEEYTDDAVTTPHNLVAPDALGSTQEYRAEKLPVRKFDKTQWKSITKEHDYKEAPDDSDEKKKEQKHDENNSSSGPDFSALLPIMPYIGYGVIVCLVGVILYLIIRNTSVNFNRIPKAINNDSVGEDIENIEEFDGSYSIGEALKSGNFKLAIRLYYLQTLKHLNERGIILWKKDKTNREYLNEVNQRNFYPDEIHQLTRAYEVVWYGEHQLVIERYQSIIDAFKSLETKITAAAK